MQSHRLRCECGVDLPVTTGQAGGKKVCPHCGKVVDIPPLRDLRRLPLVNEKPVSSRVRWGFPASLTTAGVVIAMVSWVAAALLSARVTPREASVVSDPAAIARSFDAAPLPEVYGIWWSVSRVGVDRGQTPEETAVNRISRGRLGMAYALVLFGGLGAIVAITGLILAAARRTTA